MLPQGSTFLLKRYYQLAHLKERVNWQREFERPPGMASHPLNVQGSLSLTVLYVQLYTSPTSLNSSKPKGYVNYVCMHVHVYTCLCMDVGLREAKEKKWSNPPQSYHTHVYVSVGFRLGELAPFTIVRAGLGFFL